MRTDRNWVTKMRRTAAILACMLLSISAIASEPSVDEQLLEADEDGSLEQIKTLLAKGGDVNAKDENGQTLLMKAAESKNLEIVKFLIDRGADLSVEDERGETVLTRAIESRNIEVVKLLIDKGLDVNAGDESGESILMYAAGSKDLEAVKFLIDRGADLSAKDENGRTVLMYAATRGNLEVVRFLVDKGANVNTRDKNGHTVLMDVAKRGDLEAARLLIDKAADVNATDGNGETVLMKAVGSRDLEIVKFLVDRGADVNAEDAGGRTALALAFAYDHPEVVQYLKTHGATSSDPAATLEKKIEAAGEEPGLLKEFHLNPASIRTHKGTVYYLTNEFVSLVFVPRNEKPSYIAESRWYDPTDQEFRTIMVAYDRPEQTEKSPESGYFRVHSMPARELYDHRPGMWKVALYIDNQLAGTQTFFVKGPVKQKPAKGKKCADTYRARASLLRFPR